MYRKQRKIDRRAAVFAAIAILVIGAAGGAIAWLSRSENGGSASPAVSSLASCLTEKGTKMYGASWCAHCNQQKKEFGSAFSLIDYVECVDQNDRTKQAPECDKAGVTSYPTWTFADGSRLSGEVGLTELSAKAGCTYAPDITIDSDSIRVEAVPTGEPAAEPETPGIDY